MGFKMTEDQVSLRDMIRSWLESEVKPKVGELDEKGECPLDLVQQGMEMGLHMIEIPEEYGGLGMDARTSCIVQEELCRIDVGFAGCFSVTAMAAKCVMRLGSESQKKRVGKLLSEGKMAAFCLTEPQGGSDSSSLRTTAVRDGDNYIINGNKCFITNGGYAGFYLVMAVTDKTKGANGISAFIVEAGTPGLITGKEENKMGTRLSNTTEVVFDNVVVPKENMVGEEGSGFKAAMKTLDSGRASVAAGAVGIAQRALEEAVRYSQERVTFGKPICRHQAIQFKLADMSMRIEASRQLVEYAVELMEAGKPFTKAVAMAKCYAGDTAMYCAIEAVQIFGGYGYCKDYPVEKLMRDAKLQQIAEGSQEIQRIIIGRAAVAEQGMADYIPMN